MRYIFPVHLMDNKFGGTPIVSPMLNMASKFLNGSALDVEPAGPGENISFWLPEQFDLLKEMESTRSKSASQRRSSRCSPLLPAVAEAWGGIPLRASGGLMPLAMLASVGAVSEFGEVIKAVPPDVWPAGNNYPTNDHAQAPWGHKNSRGLTALGEFAVTEMMKRGMMIDVDHMGQRTIDAVFKIAEANPVGYPLNSGHNSFRDQATEHRTENHRTGEQMARIRKLGGLFGVGYENSSQYSVVAQRQHTVSHVDNDCGGTSKTVRPDLSPGTGIHGRSQRRFGHRHQRSHRRTRPALRPQPLLRHQEPVGIEDLIRSQRNGVLYEPMHGRPIVGPAFLGRGVDPGQVFGWGRDEHLDNGNLHYGYTYGQEQRDFFLAIRIFYHFKKQVSDGLPQATVELELGKIRQCYERRLRQSPRGKSGARAHQRNHGLAFEQLSRFLPDRILGRLVFQIEVLDAQVPGGLDNLSFKRLSSLRGVWNDYHYVFGGNEPLKRSKTGPKDWTSTSTASPITGSCPTSSRT